ncbi:MAG: membrane fusion protein (multidrug efflux system) [Cyclobacteriaceae bacterium]|jgi:membrane fusion protein (multidrug efflux system)
MRPLIIIISVVVALFLFKIIFLDDDNNDASESKASDKSSGLEVDIYVAEKVSRNSTIYASGTTIPNEEVEIKSEVSGRLVQLNINEGGFVKKGQLIAKLDDSDIVALIKKLKYEEELASQIEIRQKKLLDIDAISKEEYDMAVTRVNTLGADMEFQQVQLEKTSIKAPFSGRMGFKNISKGAYITPNIVIANLVQTNPVKLDFSLPEKYATKVINGQAVSFSIDGDDEKLSAEVIALDPKIDEELRTLKVRAKANNEAGKFLPGMFIRVEIPLGKETAIMIPTEAVIPILKGKKVYIKKNGVANEVVIKTGLRTETEIQVEEGLMEGDSVIVSALMSVKNKSKVSVRNIVK